MSEVKFIALWQSVGMKKVCAIDKAAATFVIGGGGVLGPHVVGLRACQHGILLTAAQWRGCTVAPPVPDSIVTLSLAAVLLFSWKVD